MRSARGAGVNRMDLTKEVVRTVDAELPPSFREAPRSGSLFNVHTPHVFRLPRSGPSP